MRERGLGPARTVILRADVRSAYLVGEGLADHLRTRGQRANGPRARLVRALRDDVRIGEAANHETTRPKLLELLDVCVEHCTSDGVVTKRGRKLGGDLVLLVDAVGVLL